MVCAGQLGGGAGARPALPGLLLPVIVLVAVAGVPELVYVTLSTYLQHNTRSEFRATSMSIAEAAFSIQMLWLFPLVGYDRAALGVRAGATRLCAVLLVAPAACSSPRSGCRGCDDGRAAAVAA